MIALKLIIMYLSIAIALTNATKIKFEKNLIIGTGLIYSILYLTGIFNILKIGVGIIYSISILSCIYSIYSLIKNKNLKDFLKPSVLIWILGVFILYFICKDSNLRDWDEFSHWGTNLKAMYHYDIVWANKLWNGVHVVYPPLAGLVEYLSLKMNNSFQAWVAFFALDVFMLNFFMIVFRKYENRIKDYFKAFLILICIFCTIYIFNFNITTLYIDLALGVLFFIGLYVSTLEYDKENKMLIGIIFFLLPMMKDSGLILSAVILINLFVKNVIIPIVKKKKITKIDIKKIKYFIAFLIIIFGSYLSWKGYTSLNNQFVDFQHDSNAVAQFNLKEYIKSLLLITSNSKNYDIACAFYNFLNSGEIIGRFPFKTIVQIVLMLNLVGVIYYFKSKDKNLKERIFSILTTLNFGSILYYMFLLVVFLFAFLEPEGRVLASIDRYSSTFLIGFVFLLLAILNENKKNLNLFLCLILCLYGTNVITLIKPVAKQPLPISEKVNYDANILSKNVNYGEKVYIVMQNTGGGEFHHLRYLIAPIQTNLLYEWNVGTENIAATLATIKLTPQDWKEKLVKENFDFVYLSIVNEGFIDLYEEMFDSTIENNTLFKVEKNDTEVLLKKVDML